ncbi:hypothetical protein [Endozoicomonas sp. YOMI1]|uniref:hypothetical protein n=1 Tax=Endozoicomonas sp. YOMI1 TaxID=2828739 RepID=UPI00214957E8|nr:hypothetical protein [Endozoicomonas sp. YOMI1]
MSKTTLPIPPLEAHKRDCLARYYLDNKSRDEIAQWLERITVADYREDMRERLNTQINRLKQCRKEIASADPVTWHWMTDQWTVRELEHCLQSARLDAHGQTALKIIIERKKEKAQ